ncbi:hypothetical protein [Haladaptatus sp. NG-SE-30]
MTGRLLGNVGREIHRTFVLSGAGETVGDGGERITAVGSRDQR